MDEVRECPLCKMPVRIIYRDDGYADHYESLTYDEALEIPNPCPPAVANYLRAKRQGKKTVAIVGAALNTGPWAPFGEKGVEIWTCNEMHALPWVDEKDFTAWFQLHPKWSFTREHDFKHWEWLQKEHSFPIYMQMVYDDVPSSVKFPLRELQKELIHIYRGELPMKKIFSSTFTYQMAMALSMGYERIEIYGIEMVAEGEYAYQREAMSFWMGKADGMGVEVWVPSRCSLLLQPLYAYEEHRKGDTGEVLQPPSDCEED